MDGVVVATPADGAVPRKRKATEADLDDGGPGDDTGDIVGNDEASEAVASDVPASQDVSERGEADDDDYDNDANDANDADITVTGSETALLSQGM